MPYEPKKQKSYKKENQLIREEPYTYDDYAALDDGLRYELANGKLELMSPGPSVPHQIVSFEILKHLSATCGSNYLILSAPVDVILSKYEVRQPDLVLIRRDRMDIVRRRGVEGSPDLVAEIWSPSTLKRDKLDKMYVYAHYGIQEYWLVDPVQGVLEQYVLDNGVYKLIEIYSGYDTIASEHVPCVSFTMQEIMDNVPELRN